MAPEEALIQDIEEHHIKTFDVLSMDAAETLVLKHAQDTITNMLEYRFGTIENAIFKTDVKTPA